MSEKDECYAAYAANGYVVVRVIKQGLNTPDFKEIPFKRTIAREFQDVANGCATVKVEWVPGTRVGVKLHFPVGRRKMSFLRKQTKRVVEQFKFFEITETTPTIFRLNSEICKSL